jgi:hypothetical protein
MSELVLRGGMILVGGSIVLAGIVIAAEIMGHSLPFAMPLLLTCAVLITVGAYVVNRSAPQVVFQESDA